MGNKSVKEFPMTNSEVSFETLVTREAKSHNVDKLFLDRSYGLVLGGGIGDSIGSYVEFSRSKQSKSKVSQAMSMNGGGPHGISPGQVTDDTELAISLARGILLNIEYNKKSNNLNNLSEESKESKENNNNLTLFDPCFLSEEYFKWYNSNPFDMGNCTSATCSQNGNKYLMEISALEYDLQCKKMYKSSGNIANGSLMRCMALILYCSKLKSKNDIYNVMISDSKLTHNNIYVFLMLYCYSLSIIYLLNNPSDKNRHINAYNKALQCLSDKLKDKNKLVSQLNNLNILYDNVNLNAIKDVQKWLNECKNKDPKSFHPTTKFLGYVRIAFERSYYCLYHNYNYIESIKYICTLGGDSDTNGAIVGGLIGAKDGIISILQSNISVENNYICKIINCFSRNEYQMKHYLSKLWFDNFTNNKNNKNNKYNEYVINIIKHLPLNIKIRKYKMLLNCNEFDSISNNIYELDVTEDDMYYKLLLHCNKLLNNCNKINTLYLYIKKSINYCLIENDFDLNICLLNHYQKYQNEKINFNKISPIEIIVSSKLFQNIEKKEENNIDNIDNINDNQNNDEISEDIYA